MTSAFVPSGQEQGDDRGADVERIDDVVVKVRPPLADVVLSRPEVHNALSLAMWKRIADVFEVLGDNPDVRAILLRGAGSRAFSAGANIAEFRDKRIGMAKAEGYNATISRALDVIAAIPQPVIAVIQGLAVGGGCELAAACDLRIASEGARFGIPISKLGVTLGVAEARAVVGLIGPGRAKELLLTGRLIDAAEAWRIGLVSQIVPAEQLDAAAEALAERVAEGAPFTATANKWTINGLVTGMPSQVASKIQDVTVAAYDGWDLKEGIDAFLEKRAPVFRGRSSKTKGQ